MVSVEREALSQEVEASLAALQLGPTAAPELVNRCYDLLTSRALTAPSSDEVSDRVRRLTAAYECLVQHWRMRGALLDDGEPSWQSVTRGLSWNLYELLGVATDADREVIDLAYRTMTSLLRPSDAATPHLLSQFKAAHSILTHPEQREAYDVVLSLKDPDAVKPRTGSGDGNGHHGGAETNGTIRASHEHGNGANGHSPAAANGTDGASVPHHSENQAANGHSSDPGLPVATASLPQAEHFDAISEIAAPPEPEQDVELEEMPDDLRLPRETLVRRDILPLASTEGSRRFAVVSDEDAAALHAYYAPDEAGVSTTRRDAASIRASLRRLLLPQDRRDIVLGLADRAPDLSARRILMPGQALAGAVALAAIAVAALLAPIPTATFLIALAMLIGVGSATYKAYLALRALWTRCEIDVTQDEIEVLIDEDLPVYTLMLPLYREPEVLPHLIRSVQAMDYPQHKLDVKILLEPDDTATRAAVAGMELPSNFQVLVVPEDGPKGKPKACNYGLAHARGDFVVLYDAEDRPEPDQLKKALVAFGKGGPMMSCVQAKLNYFNADQNLLTRWFTIEYSTWFELYLPGLNSLQAPIALGGTSNHFRTDMLRMLGGWDPFNVTEDADLGMRISRYQLQTGVIDSTTYEEANSRLGNWIRQRSRWIKGYLITWLVHMRHPLRLVSQLGIGGFLSFQAMIFGTVFSYFANPLFWALVGVWYATHAGVFHALFPRPILYVSAIGLFAGNFAVVFANIGGCLQRRYFSGVKYALLSPLYFLLMSVAAWKALYQLVTKPYYWEKTRHGLASTPAGSATRSR